MRKTFVFVMGLMVACVLLGGSKAFAGFILPIGQDTSNPQLVGPQALQNLLVNGASVCRLEVSTGAVVPVLCASGSGILIEVLESSGAAADYAVAFDSKDVVPGDYGLNPLKPIGSILTPQVLSAGNASATGCTVPLQCGAFLPPVPLRFSTGLVGLKSSAGSIALFVYRLDSSTP